MDTDSLFEVAMLFAPFLALLAVGVWSVLAWPGLLAIGGVAAVSVVLARQWRR
ncbi:MAG: hypothetical protein L0I24_08135 [Pseudonocardia sp.]|nr:hypothetical protein [Pseudonocardia sp.]MDN5931015.1 hypothetical protein [Pseudonocardia sp.]